MSGGNVVLRARVKALMREGMGSEAIREYRKATGCDLATARRAMEALASEPDEAAPLAEPVVQAPEPPAPFPPAADLAPSSVSRWQPVEAPSPPPPLPRGARPAGFAPPPPRQALATNASATPRTDPARRPSSNDLVVVFALALLLGALLGGGLVVAVLLGR